MFWSTEKVCVSFWSYLNQRYQGVNLYDKKPAFLSIMDYANMIFIGVSILITVQT